MNKQSQSDSRHEKLHGINRSISLILRAGIAVSLLLVAGGLILFFTRGTPHTAVLTPLAALAPGLATLDPAALITAGLIVILLLPLAVLAMSLTYFILTREKQPVIVCIVLLVMLASSLILILK